MFILSIIIFIHIFLFSSSTISITSTHINSDGKQQIILVGPLYGKIISSETTWAILNPTDGMSGGYIPTVTLPLSESIDMNVSDDDKCQTIPYILLSLIKAHGHQDIWATVFTKEYLQQLNIQTS